MAGQERGFRTTSAIYRLIGEIAGAYQCSFAICDIGPNIGALDRAVITTTDYLIVPVSSDLFSIRAVDTVGQSIVQWLCTKEITENDDSGDLLFVLVCFNSSSAAR